MADSVHLLGYQCEFIDTVHDNFYCKKCTLVARRLTYTSCCGESYCHACIADIQQQDKSCPECGHQNFSTMKPLKHQRQMDCLKVKCSMRGRGCDWLGTLGQLDAHLDPDQDNCQYVDIECPLNCLQTIPKNKLEQHVSMECVKRDSVCQYCHFKATYEVMVDTHWPVCIYFPLQCPNFCGVTCERHVMEDHMRMCRLEEVECEFSGVGCDGMFRREDQEEHTRQNNQKHLAMTATTSVKMNQKLQQKLLEQEEKLQEQEEKLQEQEEKLQEQEEKLLEQEEKQQEQEEKLQELEVKQQEQEEKLQEQEEKQQEQEEKLHEQEEKQQEQEEKLQEQEEKLQEQEEKQLEQEEKLQEQEEKLQELEEKLQEQELKLKNISDEQEEKLQEQDQKLQEHEEKLQEQELKFKNKSEEQEMRFQVLEQKFHKLLQEHGKKFERLEEKSVQNKRAVDKVTNINLRRRFAMENFSLEKVKDKFGDWMSPAMYTHMCGYKFCIGINANGDGLIFGKAMHVSLYAMQGEHDHLLKWPTCVSFTVELLHQHGGRNIISTLTKVQWQKPTTPYRHINSFTRDRCGLWWAFLEHSKLADFLDNDTLYFHLSNITVY